MSWWNPDVTPVDDNNLCGDTTDSTVVYNGGIVLEPGGDELTLACDCNDSTNPLCIEVPDLCYTVADADAIAGQLLAYFCVEHITEFPGNPLVGSSEDVIPNTLTIPDVVVSKTCDNPDGLPQGVPADFTVVVTNTGETDLSCVAAELNGGAPILLAPGEDFSDTVPVETFGECADDREVSNEVTVICSVPDAQTPTTVQDSASDTCPVECIPGFNASKECVNTNGLPQGVPADFLVTINNTGDTDLICTDSEGELNGGAPIEISAGGSFDDLVAVPTVDECLDDASVSNTTTITCADGDTVLDPQGVSDTCPVLCVPCAEASKVCKQPGQTSEDSAEFEITVENCGDLPILCTDSEGEIGIVTIQPGAADAVIDGIMVPPDAEVCLEDDPMVTNTTIITCEPSTGAPFIIPVSDYCPVPCEPCIEVEKDCSNDPQVVMEGDPIDFNIVIRNCGNTILEGIIVTDPEVVDPIPIQGPLAPTDAPIELSVTIDNAVCVDSALFPDVAMYETQENTVTVTVPADQLEDSDSAVCPCDVPTGGEGCTPGFWKIKRNGMEPCWCDTYIGNPLLTAVYDAAALAAISHVSARKEKNSAGFTEETLDDALKFKGGGDLEGSIRKLLRMGTAALLNACTLNGGGNYPQGAAAIISDINAAIVSQDIETIDNLKNTYGNWNECLPCTMNANCEDIDLEDAEEPEIQCTDDAN